jgi:hypothetical protein
MTVLKMYAVFDVKASSFSAPMVFSTTGIARRFVEDECRRGDSNMARHPEDFDLREIGEYDLSTGSGQYLNKPVVVCKASDYVVKGG